MIILEGVDGVGKTTLAKEIAVQSGLVYQHESVPADGLKRYVAICNTPNHHCIYDRFHLGEYVYPILKKGGRKPLTFTELRMVDTALLSTGSVLVHCDSSLQFIKRSFEVKREKFITLNQALKAKDLYKTCFEHSILVKTTYDPEHHNVKAKAKEILKLYYRQPRWAFEAGGIGYQGKGGFMIVGDRINPYQPLGKATNPRLPFVWHTGSSLFLHQALALTGRRDFYITNAFKHDSEADNWQALANEITRLEPAKIICLGQNAARLLNDMDLPFIKTHHPAYWSRFKSKEIKTFANILKCGYGL